MNKFYFILIYRSITRRFKKAALTFTGIALTVAALVLLESTMQGVSDSMINNSVAIHQGHIACSWNNNADKAENLKRLSAENSNIKNILIRKKAEGALIKNEQMNGVIVYGIKPLEEQKFTVISKKTKGKYEIQSGEIIIGSEISKNLGVKLGDEINFLSPDMTSKKYKVSGIFNTGINNLDERIAYVLYDNLKSNRNEASVFLKNTGSENQIKSLLKNILPTESKVNAWDENMPELFQLLSLNRVSMNVVLFLALLIMVFGISNTIIISVSDRTREFGILKSLGFTSKEVLFAVIGEFLMLVTLAGIAGIALGAVISAICAYWGFDLSPWTSSNRHFIASGYIYPRITSASLILPLAVTILCGVLASIYPAIRASKIKVVEALRTL